MLRRLGEAAERGESHTLWGTRPGVGRRGYLPCIWEELVARITGGDKGGRERWLSLFHCCKVTNDHKKQNKKGGSGGAQGEVQLVLWEI